MLHHLAAILALLLPHFPYAGTVLDPTINCIQNARVVAELERAAPGRWRIVPNCQWDALPEHLKLLSIAHELAHLERRHTVSTETTEREADELAARTVSRVMGRPLEETWRWMLELRRGQVHAL
jgi:hypothetical protein